MEWIKQKFKSKVLLIVNIIREERLQFSNKKKHQTGELNFLILGGSQAAQSFGVFLPKIFQQCVEAKIKINIIHFYY